MKKLLVFITILVALLKIGTTAFAVDLTTPSVTSLPTAPPTVITTNIPSELPTVEPTAEPDDLDFLRDAVNDLFALSLPAGTNAPITISGSSDYNSPTSFSAEYSCGMESEIKILDIKFEFEDSKDKQSTLKYEVVTEAGDTLSVRRNYTLYYDREAFLSGAKTIINGIYLETIKSPETSATIIGKVEGQLMMFESDDYAPDIAGKNLIMLTHLAEESQGLVDGFITNLVFFLDPLDAFAPVVAPPTATPQPTPESSPTNTAIPTVAPTVTPIPVTVEDPNNDSPTENEPSTPLDDSGMPQPFDPLQVSLGAIFVAAFISLTNATSSIAGAGMGAFKMVGPTAPAEQVVEVKDAPGALPKQAAKERFKDAFQTMPEPEPAAENVAEGTIQEESESVVTKKKSPAIGKIVLNTFAFIADFIKQLLANLRDMLTDEARSHTSGKIAETLDDGGDIAEMTDDSGDTSEPIDAGGE